MLDSQDLTEQELKILRGDAVGNSSHSSVWILKTLKSLHESIAEKNEVAWTEDMESKLCLLWDMSIDDDVRPFLIEHDFFNLAGCILDTSTEPRLIEIILGILVNVYCISEALDSEENVKFIPVILRCLTSSNTRVLIQILRFLRGAIWRLCCNAESIWTYLNECEYFTESIIHILRYSVNGELLIEAVELVKSIFDTNLEHVLSLAKQFKKDALVSALVQSSIEVTREKEKMFTKAYKQFVQHWLCILENLAEMRAFESYQDNENLSNLMEILYEIFESYRNIELPIEKTDFSIICHGVNVTYSLHYFHVDILPKLDHILASLASYLQRVDPDTAASNFDPKKTGFQLSIFMNDYWLKIIRLHNKEQIMEMLHPLRPEICTYLIDLIRYDNDKKYLISKKIESIVMAFKDVNP